MGLAVHAVDDQIAPVVQLVGQPLRSHSADDGSAVVGRLEHRQFARLAAHGPLQGADDVAALAQGTQCLLGIGIDSPGARLHLVGQAQALQVLQTADQQQALALQPGFVETFDLHPAFQGFALQGSIQARPSLLLHLTLQALLDRQLAARPQPFGRQLGGSVAETIGDVVARDDEVFARVVAPAHDDVHMRVVGVPVIHRHPFQPSAQVGLHAAHEVPRVGAQVFQLGTVLGRDDEAELVPVILATLLECIEVGFVGLRPVGPA